MSIKSHLILAISQLRTLKFYRTIAFNNIGFLAIVSLYFVSVLNYPLWRHVYEIFTKSESAEHLNAWFIVAAVIAIYTLIYALLIILASYKHVQKPLLVLITLLGALCTYASTKYGIIFDQDMIRNFAQTNVSEATSYLSFSSVLSFILLGMVPAVLIIKAPITYLPKWWRSVLLRVSVLASCLVIALTLVLTNYQQFSFIGRNNRTLGKEINPSQVLIASYKLIKDDYFTTPAEPVFLGGDGVPEITRKKPLLTIFVLGETARAANYELLGYDKPTNEFTKPLNLFNFAKVSSCGTATAQSVPCMFSNLTRANFDNKKVVNRDGVLDVLKKNNIDITWIDNEQDCKGVCKNVKTINITPDDTKYCKNGSCLDEIVLDKVKPFVQGIKKDTLIAVHIMGSHGPRYYERYPKSFERFTPTCNRPDVENCTTTEVINAYNNTILYTDYVVASLIKVLDTATMANGLHLPNRALIYVSDRGESLGENGMYLHGFPYAVAPEEQKHVPMQAYFSKGAVKNLKLDRDCLTKRAQSTSFSHDNIFHTLIGLYDINTVDYDYDMDIFAPCRDELFIAKNTGEVKGSLKAKQASAEASKQEAKTAYNTEIVDGVFASAIAPVTESTSGTIKSEPMPQVKMED